jgi:hypothetical protein
MVSSYAKKEVLELVWLAVYIGLTVGIFTLFFGLGAGAFSEEDVFVKNNFYIPYGITFLVLIIMLKIAGLIVFSKKDSEIEGSLSHDPDQSLLGKLRVVRNPFMLTLLMVIVFGVLGWFATRFQVFFSGVPSLEQQFTKGADLFFSVYPGSPSETLGAFFLMSLFGLIVGIMALRGRISRGMFPVFIIIGYPLLSMMYGYINHLARYGGSELAITNVLVFWFIGGLITALTGSMIPFFIMHDANNFFFRLSKLFSSEIVTAISFTIVISMAILFVWLVLRKGKNKNVEREAT